MNTKLKTLMLTTISTILLAFTINYFYITQYKNSLNQKSQAYKNEVSKKYNETILNMQKYYINRAKSLSELDDIKNNILDEDRKGLLKDIIPVWYNLKDENQLLDILHFHSYNGSSFLRVHKPSEYEDQISLNREMLFEAHLNKSIVAGLEVGKYSISYRILVPIFDNALYIGLIEFGINPSYIVEQIQQSFDIQGAVFVNKDVSSLYYKYQEFDFALANHYLLSSNIDKEVLNHIKENYNFEDNYEFNIDDKFYRVYSFNLLNYKNVSIAKIIFLEDITKDYYALKGFIKHSLVITVSILLVTIIIINFGFNSILAQLEANSNKLQELNNNLENLVIKRTQKLEEAKNEAERANSVKSQFLANISHEIRTPLNSVVGFSDLLSKKIQTKKELEYIKAIKTASKSLLTLINDILDLSKIEAGKLHFELVLTDLYSMIDDIKAIFSLKLEEKNLQFLLNIEQNIPLLLVDEIRLRQVIFNLLGNAIKFTEKGFVKFGISLSNVRDDFVDLSISVEDSGIGIKEDDIKRIFESFEQSYGQSNKKYGGTGLGLSITKKLIEMMNGNISVSSQNNVGTKFVVCIKDIPKANQSTAHKQTYCTIKQKETNNKLTISQNDYETILALLENDIYKEWNVVRENNNIDEIKDFMEKILNLAQKYQFDILLEYANNLKNALFSFDIEQLDKIVSNYPTLLANIKAKKSFL